MARRLAAGIVRIGVLLALLVSGLAAPAHAAERGTLEVQVVAPDGVRASGIVLLRIWDEVEAVWFPAGEEMTRWDGRVTFYGIVPGAEYTLIFDPHGYGSEGYAPYQAFNAPRLSYPKRHEQVITGTAGAQEVDFVLDPGVELKGRVLVPESYTEAVTVGLYRVEPRYIGGVERRGTVLRQDVVQVDDDGAFSFPHVMPGREYAAVVQGASTGGPLTVEPATLTGTGSPWSSTSFQHVSGPTTLAPVELRANVPVTGSIAAPEGADLSGATAHLVEVDAAGWADDAEWPTKTAAIGPDGSFSFTEGAFPGRSYTVWVRVGGRVTYAGLADDVVAARVLEAGPDGAHFPDLPLIGPSTPTVTVTEASLRGSPAVGATMTLVGSSGYPGVRSPDPGVTVTYQWLRDGDVIPGATGTEYVLTAQDRHRFVSARAIVRAPGRVSRVVATEERYVETGAAPHATRHPRIEGEAVVGSSLSVTRGTWSVPDVALDVQWLRSGEAISGATGWTYVPVAADVGARLSAQITTSAPGHTPAISVTAETPPVLREPPPGPAPVPTTYPSVTGSAKVGGKLSVSRGSWSVPSVRLAYQWLRDGEPVVGATGASYVLKAADRGRRLSVRITASVPGRADGVSVTAPSAKVARGDAAKVKKKPKVTGTKRVGKKLKVSKGTWSLKGVKVSYQWLRNGKKISKATKRTYKLKKKDLGKRISVRVTAKKSGYKNAKFVTKKTSKIKAKKKR